jgi:hypothetical protein
MKVKLMKGLPLWALAIAANTSCYGEKNISLLPGKSRVTKMKF